MYMYVYMYIYSVHADMALLNTIIAKNNVYHLPGNAIEACTAADTGMLGVVLQ